MCLHLQKAVAYARREMNKSTKKRQKFENEVMKNLDGLYRYGLHLARNKEDANDLVQETCFRALKAADKFREGTNAKAWLFAIMRNTFLNDRRAKKHNEIPSDWTEEVELGDERFSGNPWPQPFEKFLQDILRDDINKALAQLSDGFRSVIALCDVEGFSYAEASEMLNIPIGTVRSRLHRARTSMQHNLREWFVEEKEKT